jgi:hypothetical protein
MNIVCDRQLLTHSCCTIFDLGGDDGENRSLQTLVPIIVHPSINQLGGATFCPCPARFAYDQFGIERNVLIGGCFARYKGN